MILGTIHLREHYGIGGAGMTCMWQRDVDLLRERYELVPVAYYNDQEVAWLVTGLKEGHDDGAIEADASA